MHYALFELEGRLLRPVAVPAAERLDDDLVTVQKYAGKTNEQFTRLLLNVTVASSAAAPRLTRGGLVVLDPLCGRGTTLNQALLTGHDAIGVEQDGKDVEAYATFLRTWLERKRLKHKATFGPVRRSGVMLGRRFEAEFAATKDQYRAGEVQRVTVLHADTLRTAGLLAARVRRRRGHRRAVRRAAREPGRRVRADGAQSRRPARAGPAGVDPAAASRRRGRHRLEHPGGAAC